MSLIEMYYYR